uniref:C33493/f1p0/3460 n=1 Tax=Chara corallina TaxID=43696 RepID=A0A6G6CIP4_CHACB|nr:C33493/f1p0/3460 [Chara corallina]
MGKKGREDRRRRQCRSDLVPDEDGGDYGDGRRASDEEQVHQSQGKKNVHHSAQVHDSHHQKGRHHSENDSGGHRPEAAEGGWNHQSMECDHEWHDIQREQAHENGPDGSKFYGGRVDSDTQTYFLEVGTLIGPSGAIEDEEEQRAVCAKSLEETKGSELVVACDPHCSRVLELVLSYVEPTDLVEFGHRAELRRGQPHSQLLAEEPALQSGWVQMSLNACSSHVVESFLRALVSSISKMSRTAKAEEKRKAENHKANLLAVLELLCNKFGEASQWLISNKYGSHVLRTMMQLLMGENSDRDGDAHGHGGKGKESSFAGLAAKLLHAQKGAAHTRAKIPYPLLLKALVKKIIQKITPKIDSLCMDVYAAPAMRVLLFAVDAVSSSPNAPGAGVEEGDNELTSVLHVVVLILSRGSQEHLSSSVEGRQLEGTDADPVRDMVRGPSGSHVVEAILRLVSDSVFLEIFLRFFRGHLASLALHPRANFVVQTLIACARHSGQVSMMMEELESRFGELLLHRRAGVVAALLAACGRYRVKQREACKALSQALSKADLSVFPCSIPPSLAALASNDLIMKLLWYGDCNYDGGGWKGKKKKKKKKMSRKRMGDDYDAEDEGGLSGGWEDLPRMSVMGSVILQSVFQCPPECCQVFLDAVGRLGPDVLNAAARDPGGSRVLEAYLRSGAPQKSKGKVIAKLKGRFGELAAVPAGSHFVERCYFTGDMKQKEMIAAELAHVQSELSRTSFGSILLSKCSAQEYAAQPQGWHAHQAAKEKSRQAFVDLFRSDGDAVPEGTGHEMQQAGDAQGEDDVVKPSSRPLQEGKSGSKRKRDGVDMPGDGVSTRQVSALDEDPALQEVMSKLGAKSKHFKQSTSQPASAIEERSSKGQDAVGRSRKGGGKAEGKHRDEDGGNEEVDDIRQAVDEMERPASRKDEIDTLFSRKHARKRLREDANESMKEGDGNTGQATTSSRTSEHQSATKKHKKKKDRSAPPQSAERVSKEGAREEEGIEAKETAREGTVIDSSMNKILSAIESLKGPKKRSKDTSTKDEKASPSKKRKPQFVMS